MAQQEPDQRNSSDGGASRGQELMSMAREVGGLMLDPKVPLLTKLIPVLALLYLLSPIDLIPDTVPFLTQIDDLAVLLIAARIFLELAPSDDAIDDDDPDTVDTTYRVHEP
jgi:uncharacterized membrane protein YkvA (DUF1232 family)